MKINMNDRKRYTKRIEPFTDLKTIKIDDLKIKTNIDITPIKDTSSLNHVLKETLSREFSELNAIQKFCIPAILSGKDLVCRAPTGYGKTMCFLIPMFHNLYNNLKFKCCVICPVRELCEQIKKEAIKLCKNRSIKIECVYGKKSDLSSYANTNIIIATPGKLMDLLNRGVVDFKNLNTLIFDEADRLYDNKFKEQVKEIKMFVPKDIQTCLFSATYPKEIIDMLPLIVKKDKIYLELENETLDTIEQEIIDVSDKKKKLLEILNSDYINLINDWREDLVADKVIVFVTTKKDCYDIEKLLLDNGIKCVSLHGDKEQYNRKESLGNFMNNKSPVLVATSLAARGIDVKDVKFVINYDLPTNIKEYIHRIGRTGREGKKGKTISFFDDNVTQSFKIDLIKVLEESTNHVPSFLYEKRIYRKPRDRETVVEKETVILGDKEVSEDEELGIWS